MIRIENLTVTFNSGTINQFNALDQLNVEINNHEVVNIIGGNGAGKSTLMNVIAGNIIPNYGSIIIDQQDITKWRVDERAKFVSRVFQDPLQGTFAELSIEENYLIFAARNRSKKLSLYSLNSQKFKQQVAELEVGLEDRLNQPIGMLSGGQRQLLALMMSLSAPAKILLLDEHTAALDPKIASIVMKITDQLVKKYDVTALMITHNMKHAKNFGNRILVMQHGKISHDINSQEKLEIDPVKLWQETQDE